MSEQQTSASEHAPTVARKAITERFNDLKLSHYLQLALAVILAILGWLQYQIYVNQADIMRAQVSISTVENSIDVAVHRAFVSIECCQLVHGMTIGLRPQAASGLIVKLKNSGATPTSQLRFSALCKISPTAVVEPWALRGNDDTDLHNEFIGPSASVTTTCGFLNEEAQKIADGSLHGYILVSVDYTDQFTGQMHRTQYATEIVEAHINPITGSFAGINVSTIGQHNCSDEQCGGPRPTTQ